MRRWMLPVWALVVFLSCPGAGLAHNVNVFAFVDGDEIQVECGFSKRQKVRNGKLVVTDLETGTVVLEGVTDEGGRFRFRPPDDFLATGHGLNIRLHAGEGHQDDWKIPARDLRTLSPFAPASAREADIAEVAAVVAADPANAPPPPTPPSLAEWEQMIGRVVDAKLAPVKEALARQEERAPDVRDIVGGIGWILGLLGLTAYWKYGRAARHD